MVSFRWKSCFTCTAKVSIRSSIVGGMSWRGGVHFDGIYSLDVRVKKVMSLASPAKGFQMDVAS